MKIRITQSVKVKTADHCPGCRIKLDGATGIGGRKNPAPGDITVCAYCGEILEYTGTKNNLHLVKGDINVLDREAKQLVIIMQQHFRERAKNRN